MTEKERLIYQLVKDLEQIVRNKNNMTKNTRFAVCPSCGAVSVAGEPCEYCGTPIVVKEDTLTYEERIIPKRTISPVAFAQKVSVFKNVGEYICNCAVVDMGGVSGMINLNGDFIFPLEYGVIKIYPCWIAYFQTGSDRFLFDLLYWRRLNYKIPLVSNSKWDNVPVMVHRDFFFEDGNDDEYSYHLLFVNQEYVSEGELHERRCFAVYDKDDREIINKYNYNSTVEGGIIFAVNEKYFDIQTRKVFECPHYLTKSVYPNASFSSEGGKLAISFTYGYHDDETIGLDIEGKSAEGIQKEIDRVIEENMAIFRRKNAVAIATNPGTYFFIVLILIFIFVIFFFVFFVAD